VRRKLFYNELELQEGRTLESYGITAGAVILAMIYDLDLHVRTLTGKRITLQCSSDMSVRTLKEEIHKREGLPSGVETFGSPKSGPEYFNQTTNGSYSRENSLRMKGLLMITISRKTPPFTS
jgi:hypothetical protein